MPLRSLLLIAVAAAGAVASAGPVPAMAGPVGPNQYFQGVVNGQTGQARVRVICLGPVRPGQLGRIAPGQSVMVRQTNGTTAAAGFTGSTARAIVAFFSPSASSDPSVTLTAYDVAAPIPTHITVPCQGTGQVFFSATPPSPTARSTSVTVTFLS